MGVHRLKHSFSAGELSPLMAARLDFKRYANGCHKLRNMLCTTQGPATRRPGTEFVFDLNTLADFNPEAKVRYVPFVFNQFQSYTMIFYSTMANEPKLVFVQDQQMLRTDTLVVWDTWAYSGGSSAGYRDGSVPGIGDHPLADISIQLEVTATGEKILLKQPEEVYLAQDTGPDSIFYSFRTHEYDHADTAHLVTGVLQDGLIVGLDLPEGWDNNRFDWAQSNDQMLIAQANIPPYVISRVSQNEWTGAEWFLEAEYPKDSSDTPYWSPEKGFPETISFHQQRLGFGGNLFHRNTCWLTAAGEFNNFGAHTANEVGQTSDADAIIFTLDSGFQNKIAWIQSGKAFNIGTIGSEWTVVGGTRTSLTPSNILAQRQTNLGSEKNKPLMIGITSLFVELYGRSINEFVYDFNSDSYKTSDMAILSKHVTDDYPILDWTYQQVPDSIIWSVRTDGTLLGTTYQRQHEVIGWHVHNTEGKFRALTSIPGVSREDEVWFAVERFVKGVKHIYVERLADQFVSDESIDGHFLDSHVHYSNTPDIPQPSFLIASAPSPASVKFQKLHHLEGMTVAILIDGAVYPDQVVFEGAVIIEGIDDFDYAIIGLNYISEVWPTLGEVPSSQGDDTGTAEGRMQQIISLDVDLYNSGGLWMGRWSKEDEEQEEYVPIRKPGNDTDQAVPLYTGNYHFNFPEGFDRDSFYFIRQKQPLPLTVRAVTDNIEVFG